MSAEPPSTALVRIVIDANALIALMVREPESEAVTSHIFGWVSEGVELHAPELARYKIANALTRKSSRPPIFPPCGGARRHADPLSPAR